MKLSAKIKILVKLVVFILILLTSCVEFEPVSPIPQIEHVKTEILSDSSLGNLIKVIKFEFSFIDGDADVGVYFEVHNNPNFPDSVRYGLFIDIFDKIDGDYQKRYLTQFNDTTETFDTITLHKPLYYDSKLDRVGQNKTVKGIIRADIPIAKPSELQDTFRLEFFIRDRALNKSNLETTPDLFIEQQ